MCMTAYECLHEKEKEALYAAMGQMRGLLARMQALTEARVGCLAGNGKEREPGWNPAWDDMDPWGRSQKTRTDATQSGLVECKIALESFRTTHQAPAEAYYAALIAKNPSWCPAYDRSLAKLKDIWALPEKLGSYIERPSVEGAADIHATCRSILYEHSRKDYDELFQLCAYFDLRGYQHEPMYGKWTCDGKEYKLLETIQRVQFCVPLD